MPEVVRYKTEEKTKTNVSRREFIKDAGLIVGGATVGSLALINACGGTATFTAPGPTITESATVTVTSPTITKVVEVEKTLPKLNINGYSFELELEPQWTLLNVLRDQLKLTGTKLGCDEGACGACTVLLDGVPMQSCLLLAIECVGKKIETIESLSDGVNLHPIQQAFIDNFGLECGYCTPGVLMVTKALLKSNPNPTSKDIREALAGNLCKCGDYNNIVTSVLAAAVKVRGG